MRMCGPQLHILMESGGKRCPQGPTLGPALLSIFSIDTVGSSAFSQVCGRHQAEQWGWGKGAIHMDLAKLETWTHGASWGSARPNAGAGGKPQYQSRLGMNRSEQLCPEGLGGAAEWEAGHDPAVCTCSPESKMCPGLHQKQGVQQGRGFCPCTLLCWDPT